MTPKEFRQLSRLVSRLRVNGGSCGWEWLAYHLAAALGATKEQREQFEAACSGREMTA